MALNFMGIVRAAWMGVLNIDLEVTVSWTVFPTPTLHNNDDKGKSDILGQGR